MRARLTDLPHLCGYVSLLFSAAIFGFFYAWVCSTMWGLDGTDPRVAIQAMQAMNAAVRNPVFFPAFFLTPVLLALTGTVMWRARQRLAGKLFWTAAAVYLLGGLVLTMTINVPMNETLAATPVPDNVDDARRVWTDYSSRWQVWNTVRTVLSGLSLLIATIGLAALGHGRDANHPDRTERAVDTTRSHATS